MPPPVPGSVAALGEFGLLAQITARLPQGPGVVLGTGDDAAVVAAPDGSVVVTADVLVEGRHFRRDWSSAADVGHKAAAANLADIAAMGARPTALVVGLGVPGDLPGSWVLELADGLREECAELRVSVVGGDLVESDSVVVAVTALGDLGGRPAVTRSGAHPGDVVALAGRIGWAAAGTAVLRRGFRSPRTLVDAHRRPMPPYAAGVKAAVEGATAMCDVSDGLLADLGHVAGASGVGIDLDSSAFEVAEDLRAAAAALGTDPMQWVLGGGEDHALVATFPGRPPRGWLRVGRVAEGEGVTVDGAPWVGPPGYDHFA